MGSKVPCGGTVTVQVNLYMSIVHTYRDEDFGPNGRVVYTCEEVGL